jgi:hypothetical protein
MQRKNSFLSTIRRAENIAKRSAKEPVANLDLTPKITNLMTTH